MSSQGDSSATFALIWKGREERRMTMCLKAIWISALYPHALYPGPGSNNHKGPMCHLFPQPPPNTHTPKQNGPSAWKSWVLGYGYPIGSVRNTTVVLDRTEYAGSLSRLALDVPTWMKSQLNHLEAREPLGDSVPFHIYHMRQYDVF